MAHFGFTQIKVDDGHYFLVYSSEQKVLSEAEELIRKHDPEAKVEFSKSLLSGKRGRECKYYFAEKNTSIDFGCDLAYEFFCQLLKRGWKPISGSFEEKMRFFLKKKIK